MRPQSRLTGYLLILFVICSASALVAQQYCLSGTVTKTVGISSFRVGDPIALTMTLQPGSQSCQSLPEGLGTTCSAHAALQMQSGTRHWSSVGIPLEESAQIGAVSYTTPDKSITTISLDSDNALEASVHFVLSGFPGNLLAGGTLPLTFPSHDDIAASGAAFTLFVMEGGGPATISYTGQTCAASACPEVPAPGDVVVYRNKDSIGQDGKPLIQHTGIVAAVNGSIVTKIVSKWGDGALYEHDPDDVLPAYGTWSVYCTQRGRGNQLNPGWLTDKNRAVYVTQPNGKTQTDEESWKTIDAFCPGHPGFVQLGHPTWKYNCHGYTFAASQAWINSPHMDFDYPWRKRVDNIQWIIDDNQYNQVSASGDGGHCGVKRPNLPIQPLTVAKSLEDIDSADFISRIIGPASSSVGVELLALQTPEVQLLVGKCSESIPQMLRRLRNPGVISRNEARIAYFVVFRQCKDPSVLLPLADYMDSLNSSEEERSAEIYYPFNYAVDAISAFVPLSFLRPSAPLFQNRHEIAKQARAESTHRLK